MADKLRRFLASIRFRMLAIYISITALALVAILLIVTRLSERFLITAKLDELLTDTNHLSLEISPSVERADYEKVYDLICEKARALGGRVMYFDMDGIVLVDSASLYTGYRLPYSEVSDVIAQSSSNSYGFHSIKAEDNSHTWSIYYSHCVTLDGLTVGVLMYSVPIQDVVSEIVSLVAEIALIFLLILIVISIACLLLSQWFSHPIDMLTNAVRQAGNSGIGIHVDIKGNGETAELGHAINRMSEQIEAHNRVRDDFVANASHELKTPLATMKLLSESVMYEEGMDEAMMREFFNDVSHEVDRLSDIVSDLLQLVQYDSKSAILNGAPFRLDQMVDEIIHRLTPLSEKKGIKLIFNSADITLVADRQRLSYVFSNLIDNAIKYTDKGSVTVTLSEDGDNVIFDVTDTGIGINEYDCARIFDRFYRVDKARSRATGGTGLGLSIAENVVALHGGSLKVKSKEGLGSSFTVTLPKDGLISVNKQEGAN